MLCPINWESDILSVGFASCYQINNFLFPCSTLNLKTESFLMLLFQLASGQVLVINFLEDDWRTGRREKPGWIFQDFSCGRISLSSTILGPTGQPPSWFQLQLDIIWKMFHGKQVARCSLPCGLLLFST